MKVNVKKIVTIAHALGIVLVPGYCVAFVTYKIIDHYTKGEKNESSKSS